MQPHSELIKGQPQSDAIEDRCPAHAVFGGGTQKEIPSHNGEQENPEVQVMHVNAVEINVNVRNMTKGDEEDDEAGGDESGKKGGEYPARTAIKRRLRDVFGLQMVVVHDGSTNCDEIEIGRVLAKNFEIEGNSRDVDRIPRINVRLRFLGNSINVPRISLLQDFPISISSSAVGNCQDSFQSPSSLTPHFLCRWQLRCIPSSAKGLNQQHARNVAPREYLDSRTLSLQRTGLRNDDLQIVGQPSAILDRGQLERLLRSRDRTIRDVGLFCQNAQLRQAILYLL